MSTSFQEAVEAVAKRRNISEDEAALIVAEEYAQVAAREDAGPDDGLLDEVDEAEVWLRQHEVATGRPVPIDEERSPFGMIQAQADRMEAKREGDRYRELSKRTSLG
jgi:hypothetical protein